MFIKSILILTRVGLLDLVSTSYLIAITQHEQVAQIRGKEIYAVRDVVLLPLSSQAEAEKAIKKAPKNAKPDKNATADVETEESDIGEDVETASVGGDDKSADDTALEPSKDSSKGENKFVKNVIQDKGRYGRFATRWFSKNGSNANARRKQGLSGQEDLPPERQKVDSNSATAPNDEAKEVVDAKEPGKDQNDEVGTHLDDDDDANADGQPPKGKLAIETLTPRIVRSARLFFSWSGFFYSYEHDLSGTLMQKGTVLSALPMWKRFDPLVSVTTIEVIE